MSAPLIYEELVASFEHGLLHQLRGHNAAVPYLDIWVPDDDPVRSVLSMLEAAEAAGETTLSVAITEVTLPTTRRDELVAMASAFGAVATQVTGDGIVLAVNGIGDHR